MLKILCLVIHLPVRTQIAYSGVLLFLFLFYFILFFFFLHLSPSLSLSLQCFLLTFLDHMLTCEWDAESGWGKPKIVPYQNLSLDPATCVLHYAFTCFEGLKAYRDSKGQIRLFRPDKNAERFNKSSARIALPVSENFYLFFSVHWEMRTR